jgi:hypothetical protein
VRTGEVTARRRDSAAQCGCGVVRCGVGLVAGVR